MHGDFTGSVAGRIPHWQIHHGGWWIGKEAGVLIGRFGLRGFCRSSETLFPARNYQKSFLLTFYRIECGGQNGLFSKIL